MRFRDRGPRSGQERRPDNKRNHPNNSHHDPRRAKRDKENQPSNSYNHNHVVFIKDGRDDQILKNFEADILKRNKLKKSGVVFFDSLAHAKNAIKEIQEKSVQVDELNIVIRAEASMDDPELCKFGKVFAGAAWTLIHERRVADGYYNT